MCYAKPGRRCTNHARDRFLNLREKGDKLSEELHSLENSGKGGSVKAARLRERIKENDTKRKEATRDFMETDDGLHELKASGNPHYQEALSSACARKLSTSVDHEVDDAEPVIKGMTFVQMKELNGRLYTKVSGPLSTSYSTARTVDNGSVLSTCATFTPPRYGGKVLSVRVDEAGENGDKKSYLFNTNDGTVGLIVNNHVRETFVPVRPGNNEILWKGLPGHISEEILHIGMTDKSSLASV